MKNNSNNKAELDGLLKKKKKDKSSELPEPIYTQFHYFFFSHDLRPQANVKFSFL